MRTISTLPNNDRHNGWSALLPERKPNPVLQHAHDADYLIVGAGFAGLAAARRLAELRPNDTIVLLEAEQVGEGAQGRNSGFVIGAPHQARGGRLEIEQARKHLQLSQRAIEYLQTQVETHGIDCDWRQEGCFHTAASDRGAQSVLSPRRALLEALDIPFEWLEGAALQERVGFDYYKTGLYTPSTILLNPSALTRGLADSLPANVHLFEYSPVLSMDLSNDIRVRTPAGSVHAKKLLLAVNGFIEQFGFYRGRLMHFAAHASLTEPMNDRQQAALTGQKSWGIIPVNALVGTTLRRTTDQRLLIRQHVDYVPSLRIDDEGKEAIAQRHEDLLHQRFPMLSDLSIEHTWTGLVCMSRNSASGFGMLAPNVYGAVCHNGIGITTGTVGGLLAAELACGEHSEHLDFMLQLESPASLLPQPFLGAGVRSRLAWEKWRRRAES